MRLIDADALFEDCMFSSLDFELGLKEFINDAPTIDAVPVVRCRDCMHVNNGIGGMIRCTLHGNWFKPDHYCAYGARGEVKE